MDTPAKTMIFFFNHIYINTTVGLKVDSLINIVDTAYMQALVILKISKKGVMSPITPRYACKSSQSPRFFKKKRKSHRMKVEAYFNRP